MVELPPGVAGHDAVTFDVRCFVVGGSSGVVLVDTATPGSAGSIDAALARLGLEWTDVTDVVLTHRHFDHVGGLSEVAERAPHAKFWAGAEDIPEISRQGSLVILAVADGQQIGELRVLTTPGHTPGHISLLHEAKSSVIVGDLVGSSDDAATFGPPAFTADPAENARSLRRVLELNADRILFSHGDELSDPAAAVRDLLDQR
jgi:glyoxylase-like metal-dependent hydrolase (beta-lactamase superfamily II)